ncbi:MAG: glycosyltransferase family 9 protein [Steroidobacteraceae bacterium]|jgi:heptosyltransferase-2/heptosyltransferase-3
MRFQNIAEHSHLSPAPGAANDIGRPLIVRCGAFGDMVLLTALIRPLHARFGLPIDILTSGPWSEPLLSGQPGVGDILTVRSRKTPYWLAPDQRRAVRRLRARSPGPTWLCDGNDAVEPMLRRVGIPGGYLVDVRDHPRHPGEHAVEQWRRLAAVMPVALQASRLPGDAAAVTPGCHLIVGREQRGDLDAWLHARGIGTAPLLLVQAGNKRTMRRGLRRLAANHKYWPSERWGAVIRCLRERHPTHRVILLGTGPEQELNRELIAAARIEGPVNAAGELPIPRLIALLERAQGLVTVDSGPAHAAAAVGCPQVVLFGKASPSLYRPWGVAGADVRVLTGEVNGEPSMLGISVTQVIDAWASLGLRDTSD